MPDNKTDIFASAISDGMAAHGLSTGAPVVKPAEVTAPPAKIDTTPPALDPVVPSAQPDNQQPPAAPSNDDAGEKVSIDDFTKAFGDLPKAPEVKPVKQPDNNPQTPPPNNPQQLPSREVQLKELGIPETKFDTFRKMSNEAFAEVVTMIKDSREKQTKLTEYETKVKEFENSKGKLPASYYEHPEGYLLHPEVKKAVGENQLVQKELAHWEKQYQAIEAGEDWEDMDYDAKGNPVFKKLPSNSQAKLAVLGYIQNARGILQQNSQYLHSVSTQWNQMHQQYVGTFANAADQYFPQFKGKSDNQYINTMNKLMAERGQGHNPLLPIFSRMYAALMDANSQLSALKAAPQKPQSQQPPSSGLNGGGNTQSNSADTVSVKEFEEVMNRR